MWVPWESWEWWVANRKTQPVASLETRIRVVTSIEDLNFWESIVLYMRVVLWSFVANYGLWATSVTFLQRPTCSTPELCLIGNGLLQPDVRRRKEDQSRPVLDYIYWSGLVTDINSDRLVLPPRLDRSSFSIILQQGIGKYLIIAMIMKK